MDKAIRVRGARENNLKGIDVDIPRGSMTVLTGPSGSGKSSLAFNTIYAEGQRRYVESLSTYAKQFLQRMPKPAVDRVDGVSPSVAIDQRNSVRTSRSTVGTVTEVYDYMRLLWARVGRTVCLDCDEPVEPDTVHTATDRVLSAGPGRVYITFSAGETDSDPAGVHRSLLARGYLRAVHGGREIRLEENDVSPDQEAAELLVVVDRLRLGPESSEDAELRGRIADGLAAAFAEGLGRAVVLLSPASPQGSAPEPLFVQRLSFDESVRCSGCGRRFAAPAPLLFSFNHPTGACPECNGFGATLEYDEELIVPEPERSLSEGALDPWTKPRYARERADVLAFAVEREIDVHAPWRLLPAGVRSDLLHGSPDFVGVIPFLESRERKRYKQYIRVFLRQYQRPTRCAECAGARLGPDALAIQVGGQDISATSAQTVRDLRTWIGELSLSPFESKVAASVLEEITDRLTFLENVGLGYLSLSRQARSLSGGEMQRIRLAGSLGSRLVDTLYVLDEPTIGLHPRDVEQFLSVLRDLRDRGNTLLIVEHDEAVLRSADHILELGPGSGELGGELVLTGGWEDLLRADTSTGRALRAEYRGKKDRRSGRGRLRLVGASLHNVENVDLDLPLGILTVVTGVSGSGKSTLVHDILFRALEREMHGSTSAREHLGETVGTYSRLEGTAQIDDVVLVDQAPIGRTPRSNPVTYIGAFDRLRALFAEQSLARERGYGPGHFSFNVAGGRCEACKGAGQELVEMVFLADVAVPCEVCSGRRFRPEILEVTARGFSIHDALQLTVDEAIRIFAREARLGKALWQLQRVGLGYLRLGQPATTLSGGESQRLKIARELAAGSRGAHRLYILDEPTTGLGAGETGQLVDVLDQLVAAGHTVLVIEHNLDVLRRADWVIDMGPGAADEGGRIVAAGTPEHIASVPESHTGRFLAAARTEVHAAPARFPAYTRA
ncbi:MAG: excinuclease ABC subunit UvrA [Gemmatimonadota bacterium]